MMFFTKSAVTFGRTYAAHSDLPRKGIIFNIPALFFHDPLHVIVKITINNKVLFTAFHITLVHWKDHISLLLAVLLQQMTNFTTWFLTSIDCVAYTSQSNIHTNPFSYESIVVQRTHITFPKSSRCAGITTFLISAKSHSWFIVNYPTYL